MFPSDSLKFSLITKFLVVSLPSHNLNCACIGRDLFFFTIIHSIKIIMIMTIIVISILISLHISFVNFSSRPDNIPFLLA